MKKEIIIRIENGQTHVFTEGLSTTDVVGLFETQKHVFVKKILDSAKVVDSNEPFDKEKCIAESNKKRVADWNKKFEKKAVKPVVKKKKIIKKKKK